ncbi:MAG: hypothetical protein AAF546_07695 [Verrucomicrobiota bacterium]
MKANAQTYQLAKEDRISVLRKTQEREIETLRQLHTLLNETEASLPFIISRQQMHLKRRKLARLQHSIHVHTRRLNDCRRKIIDQNRCAA